PFKHILWRDDVPGGSCTGPADLLLDDPSTQGGIVGSGVEFIPGNSQLTQFSINPLASPYGIAVSIAFVDNDLLNRQPNTPNTICLSEAGDEFCSTSSLYTTAVKRLDSK